MTEQGKFGFPIIHSLEGGPSADGVAMLVEATAFDGSVLRFAIPVDNIKHFVAFLLVWAGEIGEGQSDIDHAEGSETCNTLPIPATSFSIGEPDGDKGYLGISVGRAELVFSLPVSALKPLGQSLLLAGTSPSPAAS